MRRAAAVHAAMAGYWCAVGEIVAKRVYPWNFTEASSVVASNRDSKFGSIYTNSMDLLIPLLFFKLNDIGF